jgi:phage gp29-like protein
VSDNPNGLDRNGGTDGPPAGGVGDGHPNYPVDRIRPTIDQRGGDSLRVNTDDPAFTTPGEPLKGAKQRTGIIYRDIPLVTIQTSWTPQQAVGALTAHMIGMFDQSAMLADSILGDPRVQASLNTRMSGLFGRDVRHRPANDSSAAREVYDAWVAHWPQLFASGYVEMHAYQILMGFSDGQLVWDDSGDIAKPYLSFWHPRFEMYRWDLRRYMAITQDGPKMIFPGDGKWVHHTPKGDKRAWIWGAIRAATEPWLIRHLASRDMARFSEVHGMPIRVGKVPAVAAEDQRQRFQAQLANLGSETTMILPQGVTKDTPGYEVELVEAESTTWQIFGDAINRCDVDIVLALVFQNLTTEIKGGSYAAAESHMDVLQFGIENDNTGWLETTRTQIGMPFAYLNYGDAELAPYTDWDVTRRTDFKEKSATLYSFGQFLQIARQAGIEFTDEKALVTFASDVCGVKLPDSIRITEPDAGSGAATPAATEKKDAPSKE